VRERGGVKEEEEEESKIPPPHTHSHTKKRVYTAYTSPGESIE
jgi:hypothetical protein